MAESMRKENLNEFKISKIWSKIETPNKDDEAELCFTLERVVDNKNAKNDRIVVYTTITKNYGFVTRAYSTTLDLRSVRKEIRNLIAYLIESKLLFPVFYTKNLKLKTKSDY